MSFGLVPSRDGLIALVKAAAGPRVSVVWRGQKRPFDGFNGLTGAGVPITPTPGLPTGMACRVTLSIPVYGTVGVDDYRRKFNEDTSENEATQVGERRFTLAILIESDVPGVPLEVAERIRLFWLRNSFNKELNAIGCAIRDVTDVKPIAVPAWGNSAIDAASLDLLMSFNVDEKDPTAVDDGWIETVTTLNRTGNV